MSTGRLGAGDTAIQPTILNAKGDLIAATAADTPAALTVGANGTVLTAASGEATGLQWAAVSAGFPAATSFTPTVTSQSGTITTYSAQGYYYTSGKIVIATYRITLTTVGTATGTMTVDLPVNATTGTNKAFAGSCWEINNTGNVGVFNIVPATSVSTLTSRDYAFSTWFTNGNVIIGTIAYEVA
jgi:hypothetical protein